MVFCYFLNLFICFKLCKYILLDDNKQVIIYCNKVILVIGLNINIKKYDIVIIMKYRYFYILYKYFYQLLYISFWYGV